jgi:DeoR/GlpR family transcriptional regulator of sugar metabolism
MKARDVHAAQRARAEQRRARITRLVAESGVIGTGDVARTLGVQTTTVLKDLRLLEARGVVEPTNAEHGGGYVWSAA